MLKSQSVEIINNSTILPAYYYPNKPVALNKTAYNSIDTVKHSKNSDIRHHGIENNHTLMDIHKRNEYLGNTNLIHNPIINPIDDFNRNRRIDMHKYRHVFNNKDNILKSVGYNIVG